MANLLKSRKTLILLVLSLPFIWMGSTRNPGSTAVWVSPVKEKHTGYGVFLFRNTFSLTSIPEALSIDVSADNRYKLYVNGTLIGNGPARGDLRNWYYETYDIKRYLRPGSNIIAAEVVNFGQDRPPMAQITQQTGFWMETKDAEFRFLNTGSGNWRVKENEAYTPILFGHSLHGKYYVCGPGDQIDFSKHLSGWTGISFDDSNWRRPSPIAQKPQGTYWRLIPRDIPFMENKEEKIHHIVRVKGVDSLTWLKYPEQSIVIPPNAGVSILFDTKELTIGYPKLSYSGGKGSQIKITYAESLFDENGVKGNRNVIEGKEIIGYYDLLQPNGEDEQLFEPLWIRTFRYLQLDILTGEEKLEINNFINRYHAYPLTLDARFKSSISLYDQFTPAGWRTLRLCAGETYFDCPYYEQLQYIGDTRVQALITLYLSDDDQLIRKAIRQFHSTLSSEGLTHSRHPANVRQVIPGFSLYWISMLYDYLMLRDDPAFVRQYLGGIDSIANYFTEFVDQRQMLGNLPHGDTVGGGLPEYWYFTDWSRAFPKGIPQGVYDNNSAVITLHYANTLLQASKIAAYFKKDESAGSYKNLAQKLIEGTVSSCFDKEKGLIAQTPEKRLFSQHANILAILTDAFPEAQQRKIMSKILKDKSLIQCSMYFRFYLFEALKKLDMDDEIPRFFDFWEKALAMGMTTFPEKEGNTRSDCHAWNSSPLYIFLSAFAGVESLQPGFKSVKISPRMINMDYVNATVPHPDGKITVDLKKAGAGISGQIILPDKVDGVFMYEGVEMKLKGGINEIGF